MSSVKDLFNLQGRVSVVTGGATGLGLQMATALAEAGSNIVICSRKLENCEQAAREIEKIGVKALAVGCDVTKPDQVEVMKEATLKKFGRVDALINNAGRAWIAPPEELPLKLLGVRSTRHGTVPVAQARGRRDSRGTRQVSTSPRSRGSSAIRGLQLDSLWLEQGALVNYTDLA